MDNQEENSNEPIMMDSPEAEVEALEEAEDDLTLNEAENEMEFDYDEGSLQSSQPASAAANYAEGATAVSSDDDEGSPEESTRDGKLAEVSDGEIEDDEEEEGEKHSKKTEVLKESTEEGEIDDLEDGELKSDSDDEIAVVQLNEIDGTVSPKRSSNGTNPKPEEAGICKFYMRGSCTWGSDCKFFHPNDQDKRRWNQKVQSNRVQSRPTAYPPAMGPPIPLMSATITPPSVRMNTESAWERGLRQARELVKKSTEKKEGDTEFDHKRTRVVHNNDSDIARHSAGLSPPISLLGGSTLGNRVQRRIPSLIDSMRDGLGVLPPVDYGNPGYRRNPKDFGSQVSYPGGKDRYRSHNNRRSPQRRSPTSLSRSRSPENRRMRNRDQLSSRSTFTSDVSDPWARGANASRRYSRSTSRDRGSRSNNYNRQNDHRRNNKASPVSSRSSRDRSPLGSPIVPSRYNRREDSLSASDVSPSRSLSSSHSDGRKKTTRTDKRDREVLSTTLGSIIDKTNESNRSAKRKRGRRNSLSRSVSDSDSSSERNKRPRKGGAEFFEENEDDAPAAYRLKHSSRSRSRSSERLQKKEHTHSHGTSAKLPISSLPSPKAQAISSDDEEEEKATSPPLSPTSSTHDAEDKPPPPPSDGKESSSTSSSSSSSVSPEPSHKEEAVSTVEIEAERPTIEEERSPQAVESEPTVEKAPTETEFQPIEKKAKDSALTSLPTVDIPMDEEGKKRARAELLKQLRSVEEEIAKKRRQTTTTT